MLAGSLHISISNLQS